MDRRYGTAKRNVRRTRRSSTTKSRSSALTASSGSQRTSSRTWRPSGSTATRKSSGKSRTRSRKSSGRPSGTRQWWSFARGTRRWAVSIRSLRTVRTRDGRSSSWRQRSSSRSEHMNGVSARCGTESTTGRWNSSGWREAARDTLRPRGKPSSRYSLPASERGIRCGGGRDARNERARVRKRKAASRSRTASRAGTWRATSGSMGATRGLLSFFSSFLRRLQGSSGRSEAAAAAAAAEEAGMCGESRAGRRRARVAQKRRRAIGRRRRRAVAAGWTEVFDQISTTIKDMATVRSRRPRNIPPPLLPSPSSSSRRLPLPLPPESPVHREPPPPAMGTEVAAVVDLRVLTQSDLGALAAASPYAVDPRSGRRRDADFLPPPKIDRSVFNESAGSRKQTFSRHRPATNISHSLTPSAASSTTASAPAEVDSENRLIVFHLQSLFAREDPSYPPPPPVPPRRQTLTAPVITAAAPPAPSLPQPSQAADPDREVINPKGTAVDLVRLAELVDPYGEELQKRTAGLGSESELLGFMNSLVGQWGSRRRRRKFVDAGMFGDHLPCGWKLLLGLKRKERVAWINCRRYVSPKGHQFATCKEVSSYLMSVLGYREAKLTAIHSNSASVSGLNAVNSVDLQQTNPTEEKQIAIPVTSVTLFSESGDSHQQRLQKDETRMGVSANECQKCNLTFHDQGAYMQHQLSFHQRKAKRRRVSKANELGASMDGKFETQECQKTSKEGPDNFEHCVADVKYQGQSATSVSHDYLAGELSAKPSMVPVQCGLQPMTALPQQEKEPSAQECVPGNCKDPLTEMTGFPVMERGSAAGEIASGHHKDPPKIMTGFPEQQKGLSTGDSISEHHPDLVNKSGYCKTNDEACHNTAASLAVEAESKFSTCNAANIHDNDSPNKIEHSSKDCSEISNRHDETCSIRKEVPPTACGPDESKCTYDPLGCTDTTQSKQVPEPCDLLHGKIGPSLEENNFNNQLESKPISVTLDERNLNSVDMEVDGSSIACNVAHPPSIENGKPVEDKIMDCEMTSLKDDEIKSRIRDVNLNSCLDTISSPVSGGNYDASNTTEDAIRSSIIAQCFGTSSNDDNACKDGSLATQNRSSKGENFVNQKNDIVYQSNSTMGPIPSAQVNVDCFTSEIKNYGNRSEDNAKEALVNSRNMMGNETGFDVEAYNNDIFNGTITESSLAQLNNAINMKNDFASCYSLSELNTLTGGTATDEIDIHGMRNSFVGSTSRNESNGHCTLDFDIKGSMLEALEKSDSDLENQYSGSDPTCDSLPAAGTSGNIDDFMSMQTNFGSFTSLVRAVEDVPLSRIIQDQCDLQLGFGGPKQPMYPSFEQQLRMASAGASPFGGMSRHDSVPIPEPTLMLGYAPQLGSCPPFQLGWGAPLSKMGAGCVLQSVCVWCNSQFQHFGSVAEQQQADSLGYICPSCKGKFSGHLGINGPSI